MDLKIGFLVFNLSQAGLQDRRDHRAGNAVRVRVFRRVQYAADLHQGLSQRLRVGPSIVKVHLCSIGFTALSPGPLYSLSGRISRLACICSKMWALQPVTRAITKSGVKKSMSKPIR